MALTITRKTRTILLIILAVLVVGGGGFLIWRVTREETVAPEEGEAGGDAGEPGGDYCCRFKCCDGTWIKIDYTCQNNNPGDENLCTKYGIDANEMERQCSYHGGYRDCDESTPIVKCSCQSWKDACGTNCTFPSGTQAKVNSAAQSECRAKIAMCDIQTGETKIENYTSSHPCYGKIDQCKNPYAPNPCKEPENTCEGGHWVNKPSGQYEYGTKLNPITVRNTDPDGLGEVTITLNGSNVIRCGTVVGTTCYSTDGNDIELLIDPGIQYITPDTYNLTISWKDGKGVGGSNCTLSTSFTMLEEQREPSCGDGILDQGEECELGDPNGYSCLWSECNQDTCTCIEEPTCGNGILDQGEECELGDPNGYSCLWDVCNQDTCLCPEIQENPDWTITKEGIGECIVESGVTYAKGTYTITVTNVGEGEGSIDKIVDELDEKVLEEYLNEISNGGAYVSRIITWDLEGEEETFSPEESMQFTYYIKIPQEDYGIYRNTVTAYPIQGDNFTADKSLDLTCDIVEKEEIPQTGIFDNVVNRIVLGVIFILLGLNWGSVTNTILKLNYSRKEYLSDQRMKRFERKIREKNSSK
jgi:hypothetical protein